MTFANIKNNFFKSTMKIIGNKGLGSNYIGKILNHFLSKMLKIIK
jgi:hypothetical protein